MTPEEFVVARIEDIGTSAGERVWQLKLPQDPVLPAVRVQLIVGVTEQHLRGPQGTTRTRVQVDSFAAESGADPYRTVRDLADAIRGDGLGTEASGLFGFKGEMGSPAIRVENVELVSDGPVDYEGDELRLLRIRQDYRVHWRAA